MHTFAAETKKTKNMKHRQFKTECICMVMINKKRFTCGSLREAKKIIYTQGMRGQKYKVDVVDKRTGIINDTYLMMYTNEGPIFQKQMYSRWKDELARARGNQLSIITLL